MFKLIKRILDVTGEYRGKIYAAFVFSFLKAMMMKIPIMLAFVMTALFMDGKMTAHVCVILGIVMLVSVILQMLFQHGSDRLQSGTGYIVFAEMRKKLGAHLRKMPMGYFTEGNIGKISSVLSTDMVFIEEVCMAMIADLMSFLFGQLIMIVFMFIFSPILGIVSAVSVFCICLAGNHIKNVHMERSPIKQQKSEDLTNAVLDYIEGMGIIKSFNLLGKESKTLTENFEESCNFSLDYEKSLTPASRMLLGITALGSFVTIIVSLIMWMNGTLAAPFLIGMMLFVLELYTPIKTYFLQIPRLTVMNACMDRIDAVFNETELPQNSNEKIGKSPEVRFENVSFGYGEKEVLHNISFDMKPNTMTALIGPSGGGKSTVANLLTRFWDVKKGRITIGGADIRNVPLSDLMENISVVFQRVYLFNDTVYNNIMLGNANATKEQVIEAAKKARCYDFIMQLPEGFDTLVGEGGASLSGGEMQRISIARCILKNSPIIILDEATASVDTDNERYIQQAITELCRGKTLLVIAHRLNTIRNADNIIAIENGSISEQGTHDELMAKDGVYKKFVTMRESAAGWNGRGK